MRSHLIQRMLNDEGKVYFNLQNKQLVPPPGPGAAAGERGGGLRHHVSAENPGSGEDRRGGREEDMSRNKEERGIV